MSSKCCSLMCYYKTAVHEFSRSFSNYFLYSNSSFLFSFNSVLRRLECENGKVNCITLSVQFFRNSIKFVPPENSLHIEKVWFRLRATSFKQCSFKFVISCHGQGSLLFDDFELNFYENQRKKGQKLLSLFCRNQRVWSTNLNCNWR